MNFVVGMIITSIIMTSFYEAYQYMNEEVNLYRNQNNSILDALNFEVNMNKDMLRAETIIRLSEDEIQVSNLKRARRAYNLSTGREVHVCTIVAIF